MFQGCFCPVSEGLVRRNPTERSFPSVIVARQFIRMHFILCDVSLLAGDGVQCSCSVKVSTFWKKFYSYTMPPPPAGRKKKLLFCLLVRLHAITTFNLQGAFQIGFLALKMFDKCEPVCFFMNVFIVHYGFES